MKLLKEEIIKIKSIMGLLTEEVTDGTIPEHPTPPEVKTLGQWVGESSGNVTNGKGYKKETSYNSAVVYEGKFKDGILQSGIVYGYMGGKYAVVRTSGPIIKEGNSIKFSENSISWVYLNEKLSTILKGEQELSINESETYNTSNTDAEQWYYDLSIGFYFNIKEGTLITSKNEKYVGSFLCDTSKNVLDTFWNNTEDKLDFNDGSTNIPDIINHLIKKEAEAQSLIKKQDDLKAYEIKSKACDGNCDNGTGILTYVNGNIMSGTFVDGKLQGNGSFTDKVRRFTVNGIFKDGRLDGDGTITFEDNKTYSGKITSNDNLSKIRVKTADGGVIENIVTYHQNDTRRKVVDKVLPQFNLRGDVYYLNKLETKTPIPNSTLTITKYENDKISDKVQKVNTDNGGRFTVRLDQGTYRVDVNPNNQNFKPSTLDQVTLNQDINRRIVLNKTKKALNTPDDFINIKAMTIFKKPIPTEIEIHEKSNSKLEYCERFTNYYYKSVLKTGVNFKYVNNTNLINSKNFVIGCYKEYVSKYDDNMINKIKDLSNLSGNIEVFEL